ncbi:MAG TPA: hypothetical protein VN950_08095 [Terriglobales bacterium]|nr:hypothetical protein [Terriglobales bacterium]
MAHTLGDEGWQSIAEHASKEMDSAKLMILVEKLCYALDGERKKKSQLAATSKRTKARFFPGN